MSNRISVQTRVDPRQLASLAEFLHAQGVYPKSRSHLVTLLIELVYESMLKKNQVQEIDTCFSADQVMTKMGMASLFDSEENTQKMVTLDSNIELEVAEHEESAEFEDWLRRLNEGKLTQQEKGVEQDEVRINKEAEG